jgi:asparagine synthase (glutamine-hydrolysing)
MCGIFGWVTSKPSGDPDEILDRALASLAHRGPDGTGRWQTTIDKTGEELFLGHTRLAIIDQRGGSQPFHSSDGRFVLTYNGEIYNFIELRDELVALGSSFKTVGDTEVVVEAFRHWGSAAFTKFRGMFALAIFDTHSGQLVLARDPAGKKPLFIAPINGGFVFSSEITALLKHPLVDNTLRVDQLKLYIEQRFIDGPNTFFQSIRKLMPGCMLVYENGCATESRHTEHPITILQPPANWSLDESVGRFDAALRDAVQLRMRSDAPFGLFLSGGLDSSVLLAQMTSIGNRPVSTFSVGFGAPGFDELNTARATAKSFEALHHEVIVDALAFAEAWPMCVELRGAPVSEASDIAIYLLSKIAGRSVKMVLTGEGADELLCGYPKYWGERYVRSYQRAVPPWLHRALLHPIVTALPPQLERLKIASRAAGLERPNDRAQSWFGSCDPLILDELFDIHTSRGAVAPDEEPSHTSPIRVLQDYDFHHWLPDNLLERGDRMMMGGSVEGRMPFMDVELMRVALQIPERHLMRGRTGKHILRVLAAELLPAQLIGLPKIGFKVPISAWFRGELKPLLHDLLATDGSEVRRLTNSALIDRLLREHASAKRDHGKLLWSLANLEMFLRQGRPLHPQENRAGNPSWN